MVRFLVCRYSCGVDGSSVGRVGVVEGLGSGSDGIRDYWADLNSRAGRIARAIRIDENGCAACGSQLDKNGPAHLERTGCENRKGTAAVRGTPLTDGHKHARAMRLVAKEILKDLWIEARRVQAEEKHA